MKKIKLLAVAVMLCAGSYFGYNAYNNATMSDEERLFLDNVEALAKHNSASATTCTFNGVNYQPGDTWECELYIYTCIGDGTIFVTDK